MELVPSTARRADGLKYEIRLDLEASSAAGRVPPHLAKMREDYSSRSWEEGGELRKLQAKQRETDSLVVECKEGIAHLGQVRAHPPLQVRGHHPRRRRAQVRD